jgi:hypothetical protein
MQPMQPMQPFPKIAPWWPESLGEPATSGAQNGQRYAFFPDKRRLLIEHDGTLDTYDTGDHQIGGVSQQNSQRGSLAFTSQHGVVDLGNLDRV